MESCPQSYRLQHKHFLNIMKKEKKGGVLGPSSVMHSPTLYLQKSCVCCRCGRVQAGDINHWISLCASRSQLHRLTFMLRQNHTNLQLLLDYTVTAEARLTLLHIKTNPPSERWRFWCPRFHPQLCKNMKILTHWWAELNIE